MTFSNFAKILYPFIGEGKGYSKFVSTLIDYIMKNPNDDDAYGFTKEDSTLYKIYNGARNISKKDASSICARLDQAKFCKWLAKFPAESLDHIRAELRSHGVDVTGKKVEYICYKNFAIILQDISNGKSRKPRIAKQAKKPNNSEASPESEVNEPEASPESNLSIKNRKLFRNNLKDYLSIDAMNSGRLIKELNDNLSRPISTEEKE